MFSREKNGTVLPKASRSGPPGLSFIGPEVLVSGDLVIAGNIHADEARIAGTVEGQVSVRTLFVEASARIMGDVAYETISMDAGAQLEGRLARRAVLGEHDALIATPVSFTPGRNKAAKTTDGGEQPDIFVKSA